MPSSGPERRRSRGVFILPVEIRRGEEGDEAMNRYEAIGRLTKTPELRGKEDKPVCHMRLAIPRRPKGNEDVGAVFLDVVSFGALASACAKHLEQGRQVAVSGHLEQNEWADKETGEKRSRIEVVAEEIDFLARPGNGTA